MSYGANFQGVPRTSQTSHPAWQSLTMRAPDKLQRRTMQCTSQSDGYHKLERLGGLARPPSSIISRTRKEYIMSATEFPFLLLVLLPWFHESVRWTGANQRGKERDSGFNRDTRRKGQAMKRLPFEVSQGFISLPLCHRPLSLHSFIASSPSHNPLETKPAFSRLLRRELNGRGGQGMKLLFARACSQMGV